jgi:hypothetical protein
MAWSLVFSVCHVYLPQQPTNNSLTKYHTPTIHKNGICSLTSLLTIMLFPSTKTYINGHTKHPNGGPLVSPPITNHDPYKRTTFGQPIMPTYKSTTKLQHHTHLNYNTTTDTILYLGHPAVKYRFCQHYILLLKAPKARITGRQYMDHTCNMIQMIKTMKRILRSVKHHGEVSSVVGAFADMECLPDFDEMAAHPELLVPQKIPVDEDVILPYFPNLMEAVPGEFNVTPFVMAHNIPFHELRTTSSCCIGYLATLYQNITLSIGPL